MDEKLLAEAGINLAEGIKRMGGNRALYERFFYTFLENPYYEKLLEMIEKQDVKEAFQAAHALKGMSGNMSMIELHKAIEPLVEELRKDNFAQVPQMLENVKKAYEKIEILMEKIK